MTTKQRLDIVVLGAGIIGVTAGILLARDGHRVTLLERDAEPAPAAPETAWESWQRPGVSQFRQPHLMLPRWHHEMARELPGLLDDLLAGGARQTNLLHLQPDSITHGWQPGDEQFDTVTARRPVLEAALCRLASAQSRLTIRRGVRVTGLLAEPRSGTPHVRGLRTSAGDQVADLVVDAFGRRTPVPGWLAEHGTAVVQTRERGGFLYYSRLFRAADGRLPPARGPVLTHLPSLSVLTLPGDLGTYCVVLVTSSGDRPLRELRDESAWLAAVSCSPVAAHWVRGGTPLTGVMPFAGVEDVGRSYLRDGEPIVTGMVAIGDALATTNPALGRGATLGVIAACALRDVLAGAPPDPPDQIRRFEAEIAERVGPWVQLSARFDRHRLAEMTADIDGIPYVTDDPIWPMTTALLNGAGHDPTLARASSRIASLIAAPPTVLADQTVQQQIGRYLGEPRYPPTDPTRDDLLRAIGAADRRPPRTVSTQQFHPTTVRTLP